MESRNKVKVGIKLDHKTYHAEFVILGREEAKGVGTDWKVPRCPKCNARKKACICKKEQ